MMTIFISLSYPKRKLQEGKRRITADHYWRLQTLQNLRNSYVPGSCGASWIFLKPELVTQAVKYICISKRVLLKSKIQYTGGWLAAARLPRRLCYRPPVLFHHLHIIALSFPVEKIKGVLQKCYIIFYLFWNRVSVKLRNLELCNFGSVCMYFYPLVLSTVNTAKLVTTVVTNLGRYSCKVRVY
jgi:hypothetical protein